MSWATNYVNPNNLNIPYQGIIADGKLFTEYSPSAILNDKINSINDEMRKTTESLHKKYNMKYTFCVNGNNINELNIWISRYSNDNLYNRIVLMGIDKDYKVNDLIAELVKEYSK